MAEQAEVIIQKVVDAVQTLKISSQTRLLFYNLRAKLSNLLPLTYKKS